MQINVFLHAPLEFRIQRVREIYQARDEAHARAMIAESDAIRLRFVTQVTGHQWLNMCNYDIALDASAMPLDDIADMVVEYVRRRVALPTASAGTSTTA
jgi:cytidylate kinase